jgi:hypothetical protein
MGVAKLTTAVLFRLRRGFWSIEPLGKSIANASPGPSIFKKVDNIGTTFP